MGKNAKRRLSCFLCALLLFATGFETTAFTGVFAATARKIDVWDFGGVEESNTELYNNQIHVSDWENSDSVAAGGKFTKGTSTFGDLTLAYETNDRLYLTAEGATKNYGSSAFATTAYDDGYTAGGMFYCNGTGTDAKRYITVDHVQAGDKIVVYMAANNAATGELKFVYQGTDGEQSESRSFTNEGKKYEFVAQYSGTYKIHTTAAGGKPIYNRVVRIPGVTVSGTVDLNGTGISGYTVTFTNDTTGVTTEAVLSGNEFSIALAAGDTYTATLSGATGFGFTNDTKKVSTAIADVLNGKSNVTLKVEEKSVYTYSGKVTGFAEGYDLSNLAVTLTPSEDSLADDVVLSLGADYSFSAVLEPDVAYTAVLSGVNDYEVVEGKVVEDNQNHQSDIKVALKAKYSVSGGFLGLEEGKTVSELQFENVEDHYVYAGTVTAAGYEVSLRDGAYAVIAVVDGYKTSTHVVVNGAETSKDILFVSTAEQTPITRVSDIYVGYEEKGAVNYDTVKEAVVACAAMNPTSEEERITVHIAPGTYREQIIISTPYISFVNDSDEEVLLTWYYGIGYEYYSIDATGYYNAENAYDQYEKAAAAKWGCSTYVKSTATGFQADGITFEASFNRYITDEELEDGVAPTGTLPQRKYGTDVTSKAATERATALAIEANQAEFTNCAFLGSQDTLYTGNSATSLYFKNCRIEGNTDYIFGDGNCVFDGCELKWFGYSTNSVGGYITAHKPTTGTQYGYLFRNCTITGNEDLTVQAGYLGRPWGADAQVTFLNTKVAGDLITSEGWKDMSGNLPTNAKFHEYNTTLTDGTTADVSGRVTGVMTQEEAAKVDVTAYFGGWTPSSYVTEDAAVAFTTVPYVVDNGDINAPYPGHTLTVGYSLGENNDKNDASVIRWYLVGDDGTETLVKSSTANADKTYQITADAAGKHIKVVVIPQTISGTVGTELSYQVEAFVREGYENPSAGSSDITLGDGVNIFLAGDSTVKDYSASGMYMSGKAQAEGSWGEFLQSFFDSSVVKIQNYANGGRSCRNFINEGSLDKIKENIGKGDYLFIQFGHNDCANQSGYLEDRYVPLGEPDANGVYPTTAGTKVETPSSLTDKYGDQFYSYNCGGTYKWYLQQYIDVAKEAGAIPVLVTPVSRLYYTADGTIKAHHDSTDTTTGTQVTENNAYVTAVCQLAQEQNVLLIDAFDLTKTMYETAYAKDSSAANGVSEYGTQVMAQGDKTHSNKLGGFLTAALIAQKIQGMDLNISSVVSMPSQIAGNNPDGQQVFTVNGKNELKAYTKDAEGNYTVAADYWTTFGQGLITAIGEKKEELKNPSETGEKATVWVIGDSTVCGFNDAYYYPRYGWGTQLAYYFDETLTVNNLALSGRSSKSYTSDAEYATLMNGMQSGDYLLIGFGHNDEKAEDGRYTNPNGDYKTAGSFANSLYENYIKPAQAAGVTVVLCTPIVRRTATGEWSASNLHITTDSGSFEGGDYAQAVRKLGEDLNIPVVDMTSMTKNLYDTLGASETVNLHSWTSSNNASVDNTHTNIWGARYNAYMLTQEIKRLNVAGIAEHILTDEAPLKNETLVVNPDYKEAAYTPVTGESELWKKVGIWSGSVFGNVGGNPSVDNQTLEEDENGNIHIAVTGNKGKIASTVDGIAMYYYKVPANSNFTLTAKATIHSFASNDQVSFGLMARDDMYLDTNMTDAMGDYVAAGPLKLTKTGSVWNCFARKSGVLTQGGTCTNAITAGDTVDLKIESNSDGYACTFGKEETITGGFDFKLTTVDSEYVYVGMYVARNADVTFSDVKLVVDGVEVKADTPDDGDKDDNNTTDEGNKDDNNTTDEGNKDDNTADTGNDNNDVSDDSNKDETASDAGQKDEVTYENLTVSGIPAAVISSDAEIKKADGTVVLAKNIRLVVTSDVSQAERAVVDEALLKNGITLDVNKVYYDGSLFDADGNKVELTKGTVRLMFAYPEGTNGQQYDFNIYHMKGNGEVEKLTPVISENGIVVETTGFSPFVLTYELRAESDTEDVATGDHANAIPYAVALQLAVMLMGYEVFRRKKRIGK